MDSTTVCTIDYSRVPVGTALATVVVVRYYLKKRYGSTTCSTRSCTAVPVVLVPVLVQPECMFVPLAYSSSAERSVDSLYGTAVRVHSS